MSGGKYSLSERTFSVLHRIENLTSVTILLILAVLPILEILIRKFFLAGIPGSTIFVQHFTLWIGFLGAAIAARDGKLLALTAGPALLRGFAKIIAQIFAGAVGCAISILLCIASIELIQAEAAGGKELILGISVWMTQIAMPVGFALVAIRLGLRASEGWFGRTLVFILVAVIVSLGYFEELPGSGILIPGILIILVAIALGAPIFVGLGGMAVLLFWNESVPIASVPAETYRLVVSPTLPTIPLFTLAGYILAESNASYRLVRVFRAFFGWIPGGVAVVSAAVCTFFTSFTGGSGVTILALGGLLFPMLLQDRNPERFSLGLLTAGGSLGLLFPPSLPIILYGITAHTPINEMFLGALLPGVLLFILLAGWGMLQGTLSGVERTRFNLKEAMVALWEAKWEILLPLITLVGIFGGFATLVEAAALTALYALVAEFLLHRDLRIGQDLPRIVTSAATLIGGVLIILGVALGFTSYLVDADIPTIALEWVQSYIHSPWVFLLVLNIFLLIVGCLMDIYSAIIVVVPLILPMGEAFGIHPVHLGAIFLANLELGYLTPPVGLNLFLASYRFERPLPEIYRAALPMLAILGIGVLIITYFPWLSTILLSD